MGTRTPRSWTTWLVPMAFIFSPVACGGAEPAESAEDPEADRTRAAIQVVLERVRAGDAAGLAPRVVYRGDDEARQWQSVCSYQTAEDRDRVDDMMQRIQGLLADAEPQFGEFETDRESEGEWLVWTLRFGERTVAFACLDIDGTIALGEID